MISLILAAALSVTMPVADTADFTAVMLPEPDAPSVFVGANGVATIGLSDAGLNYDVSVAGLTHITNVAIVDQGRAVELYSLGESKGNTLQIHGMIPAAKVEGISFSELRSDVASGHGELVVFTTSEPGGVLEGRLQPLPSVTLPAPATVQPLTT